MCAFTPVMQASNAELVILIRNALVMRLLVSVRNLVLGVGTSSCSSLFEGFFFKTVVCE